MVRVCFSRLLNRKYPPLSSVLEKTSPRLRAGTDRRMLGVFIFSVGVKQGPLFCLRDQILKKMHNKRVLRLSD